VLERSPSLEDDDLASDGIAGPGPHLWSAPLPDGRAGRYVAQRIEVHHVYPEEGPDRPRAAELDVVVARGTEELVAAERRVLLLTTGSFLALIALIATCARLAVARGLEPALRLAAGLEAVRAERPPAHLGLGELPIELAPVAEKAEHLLQRVRAALERERRTTADIAHELRTPISELLTVAEVALREPEDSGNGRKALGTTRDVARHMARSVTTLLELARLEMGAVVPERAPVELGRLVPELLRAFEDARRARGLELESSLPEDAVVEGDREVLRIVLSNLLDNALHYATPGSTVTCRFERGAGPSWRFVLANRSDELEPADLRSLGEPFWRKDPARSDRKRTGLGLALSRALADKAGLTLEFELAGGIFRAVLAERRSG
jgi:signal transduction histidine kinase